MWKYNNTSELYHWGIIGMKWGVRRYQNDDGSLTPAGKRRYSVDLQTFGKKTGKKTTKIPSGNGNGEPPRDKERYSKQSASESKEQKQGKQQSEKKVDKDQAKYTPDYAKTAESIKTGAKAASDVVRVIPTKPRPRMNLDDMSNKELQDIITRENLERQYNNLFSTPSKGERAKQKTLDALAVIGAVSAIALTGFQIYNEATKNKRGN